MHVYYADQFVLPLPPGHRFPMAKYALLRERLVEAGIVAAGDMTTPDAADLSDLHLAHDGAYVDRVVRGDLEPAAVRRLGFPWSPELVERARRSVGGTLAACRAALDSGVGINLAGGTHHAFAGRGEGYCVFNDAAVAARVAQTGHGVGRVAVIDCDVHQGNGTASIFRDDATVWTYSIHGARNFPFRKEPGDVDVPLADGTGDAEYLRALGATLLPFLDLSGAELAIYVSGADPWHGDRLGRLALSKEGLQQRDSLVLGACNERGIPVAVTMAGGYASEVEDIVDIHLSTVAIALQRQDAIPARAADPRPRTGASVDPVG